VPVILDAKRGDIGSTAAMYAREAFVRYRADALTLSPFMGLDSLEPYSALAEGGAYAGKGLILLCRTSNPGGADLQGQRLEGGEHLFERVARLAATEWPQRLGGSELGLVVGATYPDEIARVRTLAPTLPLLIPGVGAQGGDAAATVRAGWRPGGPIVVNASRAVLCAGGDAADVAAFAAAARGAALALRAQLQQSLPSARA
jgi:orotidine-5'-phosphate decarboxylase